MSAKISTRFNFSLNSDVMLLLEEARSIRPDLTPAMIIEFALTVYVDRLRKQEDLRLKLQEKFGDFF